MLAENGIILQSNCPYTPQKNGIDRKYRHILDVARALKFQSGIPLKFWGECVRTVAYLINRLPTSVLQGKTPYAMLYGKPANLGHLRVFGCQSFACNLPKRDKFAPRARKAIFIGYSETQKGYRLCDPDTHIVLVSRDVKFQKYVFPFKQTYSSHDKETLFSQSAENTFDPNLPPLTAPQNTLSSTPQDEDDNSTPALTDHASTSDLHNPEATPVNEN